MKTLIDVNDGTEVPVQDNIIFVRDNDVYGDYGWYKLPDGSYELGTRVIGTRRVYHGKIPTGTRVTSGRTYRDGYVDGYLKGEGVTSNGVTYTGKNPPWNEGLNEETIGFLDWKKFALPKTKGNFVLMLAPLNGSKLSNISVIVDDKEVKSFVADDSVALYSVDLGTNGVCYVAGSNAMIKYRILSDTAETSIGCYLFRN